MRFTKKLKKDILGYMEKNPVEWDWYGGVTNDVTDTYTKELLEADSPDDFAEKVWDRNWEYNNHLEAAHADCIMEEFEITDDIADEVREFIHQSFADYPVDMNLKGLYRAIGDIDVLLVFYSNYDCCNSCDDPYARSGTYLSEVYRRIRTGVSREDFAWEFYNGAYGGALFMMGVSCSVGEYLQLKKDMEEGDKITIKKGTPFGFHSSMHGASTPFEKVTKKDMTVSINGETKYDSITPEADLVMGGYNLRKVFGYSMNFAGKLPVVKKAKKPKEGR